MVGLTDVSPAVAAPTLWNYTVCGQYPGVVPLGATVSVHCAANTPAHRYVIIQNPLAQSYLTICELEVFGCPQGEGMLQANITH